MKGLINCLTGLMLLVVTNSTVLLSQEVIIWNNEISVADGATYGNLRPRIVLTGNNVPLVVFSHSGTKQIYAARWNGSGFNTPINLLPAGMTAYVLSWTGPDVAAKGDTVVVVFKANPIDNGNVYAVRSVDGGQSFSDTVRVDDHDAGVAWLPSLDMDENGNPSVVYMAHDSLWVHPRYVVAHSTNTGLSFEPSMDISSSIPDEACDCCPAEYVIKGNREVLLYRNNEANVRDIFGVYSDDFGQSYNSFTQLNGLNWVVNSCPSSGPHGMFRANDLISVSMSRASGNTRVYLTQTNVGSTLGTSVDFMMTPPANASGAQNFPRISGNEDTIVVAWQESDPSNPEVFCGYTTTGNLSEILSSKQMVNNGTTSSQTNPDVIFNAGIVHYVFQDAASGTVIYKKGTFGTLQLNEKEELVPEVYPNPFKEHLVMKGAAGMQFEILALTGEIVLDGRVGDDETFHFFNLEAGSYFIALKSEKGKYIIPIYKL